MHFLDGLSVILLLSAASAYVSNGEKFLQIANNATAPRITDKFFPEHAYHELYGEILLPRVESNHKLKIPMRFFEIGMGVPGGLSVAKPYKRGMHVWKALFSSPNDKVFIAEFNVDGVNSLRSKGGIPEDIHVVTGDQGDSVTVQRWVNETGGNFDFVVDDGGHFNHQILTSFEILWEVLNPGGIYFIEDTQVLRRRYASDGKGDRGPRVPDIIKDWIEQLMLPKFVTKELKTVWTHKIPKGVLWIMCQNHLCAIAKCRNDYIGRCSV